jgi:hypothetical protein
MNRASPRCRGQRRNSPAKNRFREICRSRTVLGGNSLAYSVLGSPLQAAPERWRGGRSTSIHRSRRCLRTPMTAARTSEIRNTPGFSAGRRPYQQDAASPIERQMGGWLRFIHGRGHFFLRIRRRTTLRADHTLPPPTPSGSPPWPRPQAAASSTRCEYAGFSTALSGGAVMQFNMKLVLRQCRRYRQLSATTTPHAAQLVKASMPWRSPLKTTTQFATEIIHFASSSNIPLSERPIFQSTVRSVR